MTRIAALCFATTLLLGNIQCTKTADNTGVSPNSPSEGLRDYRPGGFGNGNGQQAGLTGGDAFAEQQGPLCIGMQPPEDAYLPLPVPETPDADGTTTERPDSSDAIALDSGSSSDTDANSSEDVLTADPEPVLAEDTSKSEDTDTGGDALLMRTFSATDDTENATDGSFLAVGDTEDATDETAAADGTSGGIPYVPRVPIEGEDEEPEPYDCTPQPATCIGAEAPEFALFDFQPQSCGFQATYGLELYRNHVTLVALLAAW